MMLKTFKDDLSRMLQSKERICSVEFYAEMMTDRMIGIRMSIVLGNYIHVF